eukprot:scpid51209/ scgid1539/ Protein DDI1 homolog 2
MKLTVVSLETDSAQELDVAPDMEIMNVKALLEAVTGTSADSMILTFQQTPLADDERTLDDYGLVDGGLITISTSSTTASGSGISAPHPNPPVSATGTAAGPSGVPHGNSAGVGVGAPPSGAMLPNIDWSSVSVAGSNPSNRSPRTQGAPTRAAPSDEEDPMVLRQKLLDDPVQAQLLSENNPSLYQALVSGDPDKWKEELQRQRAFIAEQNVERIRLLAADPFDSQAQEAIAERIRMENVEANMRTAMEHNPEAFGQVVMLYVNCKVNGVAVKAFVDSGAQMTIVSKACAERCNIMRLMDGRYAGIARGVGTQKILGRVHLAQIQIEDDFLQASFSILEEQTMDLLIGLDMLKRHQCCIDLRKNVLHIGTTGTETPFLAEKDLPSDARLTMARTMSDASDAELAATLAESASQQQQQAQGAQPGGALTSAAEQPVSPQAALSPANAAALSPAPGVNEASVSQLQGMGFSRQDAIAALQESGGDYNMALMSLFARSLSGVGH